MMSELVASAMLDILSPAHQRGTSISDNDNDRGM